MDKKPEEIEYKYATVAYYNKQSTFGFQTDYGQVLQELEDHRGAHTVKVYRLTPVSPDQVDHNEMTAVQTAPTRHLIEELELRGYSIDGAPG